MKGRRERERGREEGREGGKEGGRERRKEEGREEGIKITHFRYLKFSHNDIHKIILGIVVPNKIYLLLIISVFGETGA
jgi:hypothetical protein